MLNKDSDESGIPVARLDPSYMYLLALMTLSLGILICLVKCLIITAICNKTAKTCIYFQVFLFKS